MKNKVVLIARRVIFKSMTDEAFFLNGLTGYHAFHITKARATL
jgi:hypothetical protein